MSECTRGGAPSECGDIASEILRDVDEGEDECKCEDEWLQVQG